MALHSYYKHGVVLFKRLRLIIFPYKFTPFKRYRLYNAENHSSEVRLDQIGFPTILQKGDQWIGGRTDGQEVEM